MTNKRQLKRYIVERGNEIVTDIVIAHKIFPEIKAKDVADVITDTLELMQQSLQRTYIAYDRTPSQFENRAAYRRARHQYYSQAYRKLLEDFDASVAELVKKMNAALPEEVRKKIVATLAQ